MIETNTPEINVDELMEKIREEVRRRKERGETVHGPAHQADRASQPASFPGIDPLNIGTIPEPEPFELKEGAYHINDFLKYHDLHFVMNAYRGILRRRPDSEGLQHFLINLRQGKMTKAEVLGRLRYASEGRVKKVKIKGLFWNFVVQSSFRIPVLGYFSRLTVGIVNLPVIIRNLNTLEANTVPQLQAQHNHINTLADIAQFKINELIDKHGQVWPVLDQKANRDELGQLKEEVEGVLEQKADRDELAELNEKKVGREELIELNEAKADVKDLMALNDKKANRDELGQLKEEVEGVLEQKADRDELAELNEKKVGREELIELNEAKADVKDLMALNDKKANRDELGQLKEEVEGVLEQKADRDELAELNEKKVGREELIELNEAKADVKDLMALNDKKANRDELGQLKEDVEGVLEQKAGKLELSELGDRKANRDELGQLKEEVEGVIERKADKEQIEPIKNEISEILHQTRDNKLNILDQQKRLALLLEEARKRLPEPISTDQIKKMLTEEDHLLDVMYVSFEDHFRGTREDIKEKLKVYLPYLQKVNTGMKETPVLDLGCGRGEWLELCQENNLVAIGIDINKVMISQCKDFGLDVVESDLVSFLRDQKPNAFGAITGFHILEHLPFKTMISVLDETLRIIQPGGAAIFETPNPENLIVGAFSFYLDPTHRNPLVPKSMRFFFEQRGFCNVHIKRLHKNLQYSEAKTDNDFKNKWFYSEMDYAIIGYKQ